MSSIVARSGLRSCIAFFILCTVFPASIPTNARGQSEGPEIIYPGQEPLQFRRRVGSYSATNAEELWARAHTRENIKRIADRGDRMFYTHFYKGFGFQAEKEEMDLTVQTAAWAREFGMKVGVYVQWATLVGETMFGEEPRSENWVMRDRDGLPVRISYGHYYWRHLPDYRNREYMEWYKERIIRYCVEKVKPNFIFLDNVAENPPVDWQPLHNETWVNDFRIHLRESYSAQDLTRMLGFSSVDHVIPPYWEWGSGTVVNDPIMQRWIDFRCKSLTDAVSEVARFIKQLDPKIAVGLNTHDITRGNYALSGIDRVGIYDKTGVDAWEGELWPQPELTEDGVLISPIRELKAARNLGVAFTSTDGSPLGLAVNRAFSFRLEIPGVGWLGGPRIESRFGYFGGQPKGDESYKYVDYYRNTQEVADVAVLRSWPSTAYNPGATWKSTVGFEQALIQDKVPFTLVFEDDLADLSKYKVLVLANTESMADADVENIRKFVRSGGGLVATESASLYDQWRRARPNFGLGDVLGLGPEEARKTMSAYRVSDAMATWVGAEGLQTVYREFGKGRAVYIPRVVPGVGGEGPASILALPGNWPELIAAVRWAARENLSAEIQAPLTVVMNLCRKPASKQMLLHLVNFEQSLLTDTRVGLKLASGEKVRSVTLISTDRAGEESIKFQQDGGWVRFRVPRLEIYDMVVVQLS